MEIHLKSIGKFEVPMPEPAAEELVEQEKQCRRRAYYRKRGRRQRERQRQRREQEQKTA